MKKIKLMAAVLSFAIIFTLASTGAKAANAPYTSLTYDKDHNIVRTVDGYFPDSLWDKFGDRYLKSPSDLFVYDNKEIYIADTGNGRIVVCNLQGEFLFEISEGLTEPSGVFVTEEGEIFVADTKGKEIAVFDRDGNKKRSYLTPESPLFGTNAKYAPTKVAVNGAGTIYALSKGNSGGILTISTQGDFYGYFGANDTELSLANKIRRTLFTEAQLASLQKNVPASACNLDIDDSGLVYTVTQGVGRGGLKKYNLAGSSMLKGVTADNLCSDVCVGEMENIYTVSKQGYIMEYARDGELLFHFGGNDDGKNRMGLFSNATAIDVDASYSLYVLDGDRGDITVFKPTEYADTVHEALKMYQEGFYLESYEPWEEVLSKNSLFDYANRGIAKSLYKLEDYKGAMEMARLGGDEKTYSDAFWQVRNKWLRDHIVTVFFIILAISLVMKVLKHFKVDKVVKGFLGKSKLLCELAYIKRMIKNPADTFYGIKFEKKTSVLSASIIYLTVFGMYVINKYTCGFLFKTVPDGQYDIVMDIVKVLGVSLLFVICNNMICSIRDGEATFKTCYQSFAYCFVPYLALTPVKYALSHVLTYNEQFLISFIDFIIVAATGILILVMIREIQCYSYKETFVSVFLTLFTMIIIVAAGIIIFALFKQVVDFVIGIYKEGYYRGR